MTWQNPWALAGAVAIALPIAIHLLGRGHAKVLRFPSLRFFRASRLLPTRRTTIHDPWLLAVRVATLITAAAALAQPLLDRHARRADVQRRLSRAIVVDTSASMHAVADSATSAARAMTSGADATVTIATNAPSAGVRSAEAWLARQTGRRDLIVISDFARGAVDSSVLNAVPRDYGLRVMRVADSATRTGERHTVRGDNATTAHIEIANGGSTVRWTIDGPARAPAIRVLGRPADVAQTDAAIRAARQIGVPASYDSTRQVAVVVPGYPEGDSLLRMPPRESWMIDVLARLRAEWPSGADVRAAQQESGGRATLLLYCDAPPASVQCASLIAGALRANSAEAPVSELEPERIPDGELARWRREPGPGTDVRRPGDWLSGPSDGRWLWGLVLLLLGVEALVRRDRSRADIPLEARAHDAAA